MGDATVVGAIDKPGVEQGVDVAVDRLDVAADPPRHLAERERAGAGQRAQDGEALGVHHPPQPIHRRERDPRPLGLPGERRERPRRRLVALADLWA